MYVNKYILYDQPFSFTDYSSSLREDPFNPYIKRWDLWRREVLRFWRNISIHNKYLFIIIFILYFNNFIIIIFDYGAILFDRIGSQNDLIAKAALYHASCFLDFTSPHVAMKRGRPLGPKVASCFEFVKDFIIENKEECQFSLDEISQQFQGEIPCVKRIV